jgi:hypothetical protein
MLDLDFHTVGCVLLIIMPASKLPVVLCLCDQVLILVMHRQYQPEIHRLHALL